LALEKDSFDMFEDTSDCLEIASLEITRDLRTEEHRFAMTYAWRLPPSKVTRDLRKEEHRLVMTSMKGL